MRKGGFIGRLSERFWESPLFDRFMYVLLTLFGMYLIGFITGCVIKLITISNG